jgi:hypothetical protein
MMAPNRLPEIEHFPALRALPRERVLVASPNPLFT